MRRPIFCPKLYGRKKKNKTKHPNITIKATQENKKWSLILFKRLLKQELETVVRKLIETRFFERIERNTIRVPEVN